MMTRQTIIGCITIHFSVAIAAVGGEPSFTFYDIGYLGLPQETQALDINDFGVVAGYSLGWHAVFPSAITWGNGVMTDHAESIPGGWFGGISGISETGPMSGGAYGDEEAVLWRDGVGFYPEVPDGCQKNDDVLGINASGTLAVGQCEEEDGDDNMPALCFVESGVGLALGFLPDLPDDAWGYAEDVNDDGIVIGWFSGERAFSWQDGDMTEIPNLLGGTGITARAINNVGLVVGNANNTPNGDVGMSYDMNTGVMKDIGPATAKDVNERGSAVGVSVSGVHAMLLENGEAFDLHDLLIGDYLDWSIARGINNYGWIVGHGNDPDGDPHGWLLVPIYAKGDYDGDTDMDHQDFANFQRCFAAAPYTNGTLHVGCSVFDFDDDADLDLDDYAAFQSAFTGPTAPNLNPNGPG